MRNAIETTHLEAGLRCADGLEPGAQRPYDEVGIVGGHGPLPDALDAHVRGADGRTGLDLVVIAEGHAEGVEAGPHIGRGRRYSHGGPLIAQAHGHCPSTRRTETTSSTRASSRNAPTAASRWKTLAGWVTMVTIACCPPT